MTETICTANVNANSADLVIALGDGGTGDHVGRVYWAQDSDNPGYVLDVDRHEHCPDSLEDIIRDLHEAGYVLTAESLEEIRQLGE